MKIKTLLAALLVAAVSASVALAKPPEKGEKEHGKPAQAAGSEHGKPEKSEDRGRGKKAGAADCAGQRSKLELQGTLASVGADSVALAVEKANKHARELKGTQVTVQVDESTKIRRKGKATLADLKVGDRAHVHAWSCRSAEGATAPTAGSAAPSAQTIVAVKIDAHPAKSEADDDDDSPTTTTTP
jgi:hypothetical protein